MAEGLQHPLRGAGGAREIQGVGDDGPCGGEIARAMLVELGELFPRAGIEELALAGDIPKLTRRLPAGGALLPQRQTQSDPVRGLAIEPGVQRRAIAAEAAVDVDGLPETTEPRPLLGAQRRRLAEGGAEPADEGGEGQHVIAV